MSASRRHFLASGVAAAGGLALAKTAVATPTSGGLGTFVPHEIPAVPANPGTLVVTEKNILGPYYRAGAPYRGKVTPILEPGTPLLISGRVWGLDTKKPLAMAVLDVWQANAKGRYDNDDDANPPKSNVFLNRVCLITDANGYYEYETIHPGAYQIGENSWRPAHIHYMVRATGYKDLITQMYFKGDPHNKTDQLIRPSLIVDIQNKSRDGVAFEQGTFDIVLEPKPKTK